MAATQETFAIIFGNIPSHYKCKDIILNHLDSKNKKKSDISRGKLERWRRAIRLINIDREKCECHIVFSSIFYWCKYARLVLANENRLSVGIYPLFFETIQRIDMMEFISSNCNNQLIQLLNLTQNVVSYSFIVNDINYITLKIENDKELLIKIESSNISNMKILRMNNNDNNNNKYIESQLIFELNESCEIYEYFHVHKQWICTQCGYINQVNDDKNSIITIKSKYCICCNKICDKNNPFHHREINQLFGDWNMGEPNLNVTKFKFIQQTRFYRMVSSFDTNITSSEQQQLINILSPLMDVLDNRGNIKSSIMFTNRMKLTFKRNTEEIKEHFTKYMNKMDIEIIEQYGDCKHIDFNKLRTSIDSTFVWLSDKGNDFIFPILSKLLDFQNPACFSDEMDEFVAKIEELHDMGTTRWLLCEAIIDSINMNASEFQQRVESIEEHYSDKGIVDIDDETAKGPFIYEMQISPFKINIKEADTSFLKGRSKWKELESVSTENYIVSFDRRNLCIFDIFNNIKAMMQHKGHILIDKKKDNHIMHLIQCIDEYFIQYGATICNNPWNDDKLIKYYKENQIINDNQNDNDDDNNNDIINDEYFIDNSNVYQPPKKKRKTDLNNNNNNNNKETIEIISSINSHKNEEIEIHDIIPQIINIENNKEMIPKYEEIEINDIIAQNINIENKEIISKHEEIDDIDFVIEEKEKEKEKEISSFNKIIGIKRKRNEMIESSPKSRVSSLSPSPSSSVDILRPKSFLKSFEIPSISSKSEIKPKPKQNITIRDGVGWSFGVPIYNNFYFDCSNFEVGVNFPFKKFGELCVDMVCKSDLKIMRDLRNRGNGMLRRREQIFEDEACAQFLKGCPDYKYRQLFGECFTMKNKEKMDICLEDYLSKKKMKERDDRKLIIYDHGWNNMEYGIKQNMKERLLLLMELYKKDITSGVCNRQNISPPWHQHDISIINSLNHLKISLMVIDLTNKDSDTDDEDVDVDMKQNHGIENEKRVRIKQEFVFHDEYDSESD